MLLDRVLPCLFVQTRGRDSFRQQVFSVFGLRKYFLKCTYNIYLATPCRGIQDGSVGVRASAMTITVDGDTGSMRIVPTKGVWI